MKDDPNHHYATLDELRLGMSVHLEGGWLAHPFPLSNFAELASADRDFHPLLACSACAGARATADLEFATGRYEPARGVHGRRCTLERRRLSRPKARLRPPPCSIRSSGARVAGGRH